MSVVAWILQIVLALAFLGAGGMKLARPKPALVAAGMGYAEDFSASAIKTIGLLEVLGAIGLVLPAVTGIATWLVPVAAIGLALTMVGAVVVHVRRKEPYLPPLVLGVLALVLAVLRIAYPA
ncbi:DoxX family protein [Pseudonocardia petroleophila]|uniref:DoxX family protein n=1 Tax=Pseudonocardia petroleophila TaxID=37331 RepID=A0A7G7MIQ6_9PSEU|nr:DoxX family protein [Pseudonocardia petroleophila]QNG52667.1 DoxX family protein [Pseudonocardia petroleophila]